MPTCVSDHAALESLGLMTTNGATSSAGAIYYMVRNPLDVAPSYAHHLQWSLDRTVAELNRPAPGRPGPCAFIPGFAESKLPWSAHVSSWLEADLLLHVVRFEDMLADPPAAFGAAIRFAGLDWSPARLARAIDHARFDRLRAQEREAGFHERQPTAPSFFRAGTAGGWRTALTPAQVRSLVDAHAPVMERFGYLREAEAFLADAR